MIPTPPAIHAPANLDERRLLHAIAEVESGNRWSMVGAAGERTAYQIKESVWIQHMAGTGYTFALFAENRIVGMACAKMHLRWIEHRLWLHGLEVTPKNVATCWRVGLAAGVQLIQLHRWP